MTLFVAGFPRPRGNDEGLVGVYVCVRPYASAHCLRRLW